MHAYSYLLEVPGDSRLFSLYKMNKNKPQQCLQCPFLSFVMLDSKYLALLLTKALFIWRGVGPGPPPPPSQLYCASTWKKTWARLWWDWNISVCVPCVAQIGLTRRDDKLETVYMRKSWLIPQGHFVWPTEWPAPPSQVCSFSCQWWFISNCRKTWLAPRGEVPGPKPYLVSSRIIPFAPSFYPRLQCLLGQQLCELSAVFLRSMMNELCWKNLKFYFERMTESLLTGL